MILLPPPDTFEINKIILRITPVLKKSYLNSLKELFRYSFFEKI